MTTYAEVLASRAAKLLEPTEKQRAVMALIERGRARNGYPPTIREIAAQLQLKSWHSVVCHLTPLKRKGFVTWTEGKGRTLAVTTKGLAWLPARAA